MSRFTSTDGRVIEIVPGFREAVLRARPSGTPRAEWDDAEYERVAAARVDAARGRLDEICGHLDARAPVRLLEIGCGAALESAVAALDGRATVLAIDRAPAVSDGGDRGDGARRLLTAALRAAGSSLAVAAALRALPLEVREMDATALTLEDDSVDAVWSRTVLEHVQPLARALRELARVVRPGGIALHVIDPFFWVKGCHAGGLTDVPWAHARLTGEDFASVAALAEGRRRGARRAAFVATLNPLGLDGWRTALSASGHWELLAWRPRRSPLAARLLVERPEVIGTVLPGVTREDLVCQSVTVVLRLRTNRTSKGASRQDGHEACGELLDRSENRVEDVVDGPG